MGLQRHAQRRLAAALGVAACAACGCTGTPAPTASPSPLADAGATSALPYLDDASYRRSELVASLANPSDGYASLRLAYYATGASTDWDLLPEWNPPVSPVAASELDAPGGASPTDLGASPAALTLPDGIVSVDDPRLVALGARAFHLYPVQLMPFFSRALASRAAASSYGVWVDDAAGVGGLVRARMADGSGALMVTCATCHEAPVDGALRPGRPNAALEVGQAMLDAAGGALPSSFATAVAAWGPGRLDVTTDTGLEVVRIGDLRPVSWQVDLQADATVRHRDLTALAIRIETLVITSNDDALRPPRLVSLALAAYISSLSAGLPPAPSAAASSRGGELFATECASCHVAPSLSGPAVPLAVIGTDAALGESPVRGTGAYRVPSLHGAGTRGPLLHDGTVASVAALFDPARPTAAFTGRAQGTGAVPGHLYGLGLDDADRAALVAYVEGL